MSHAQDDNAVDVVSAIERHWDVGPVSLTYLPGGMNSTTWSVATDNDGPAQRWVAKLVSRQDRESFLRGLGMAVDLERTGVTAGAPEPTRTGDLGLEVADGVLALLRWVDGRPLHGGDDFEQTLMGDTLGRAHHVLCAGGPTAVGRRRGFPSWIDVKGAHLDVEDWVRPAVLTALAHYARLNQELGNSRGLGLTWGRLHADPEPEAFRWSTTEQDCALIDWSSAVEGPLLYDLASAALYVGGLARAGALMDAYARTDVLPVSEITAGLDVLLQVRWAVQADYFAHRLAVNDLTGIEDASENIAGLHDARSFFFH